MCAALWQMFSATNGKIKVLNPIPNSNIWFQFECQLATHAYIYIHISNWSLLFLLQLPPHETDVVASSPLRCLLHGPFRDLHFNVSDHRLIPVHDVVFLDDVERNVKPLIYRPVLPDAVITTSTETPTETSTETASLVTSAPQPAAGTANGRWVSLCVCLALNLFLFYNFWFWFVARALFLHFIWSVCPNRTLHSPTSSYYYSISNWFDSCANF